MRSPRTSTKSSPRLPQLEKARAQQRRPNTAKKKNKTVNLTRHVCGPLYRHLHSHCFPCAPHSSSHFLPPPCHSLIQRVNLAVQLPPLPSFPAQWSLHIHIHFSVLALLFEYSNPVNYKVGIYYCHYINKKSVAQWGSFIYLFSKYLLITLYVPGSMLGTRHLHDQTYNLMKTEALNK